MLGGMPYNVFKKLYDSTVWPVIDYSSAIWGYKSYSCINAIQNKLKNNDQQLLDL